MEFFEVETQNYVCTLYMNLAEEKHLMGLKALVEFKSILEGIPKETKVLLLTTSSKDFCLGVKSTELISLCRDVIVLIKALNMPVVCVPKGRSSGFGYDLIHLADIVYVPENFKFVDFKNPSFFLYSNIGKLGKMYLLSNKSIDADTCLELGLVARVYKGYFEALREATALANKIGEKSPLAIAGAKKVIDFSLKNGVKEGLDYVARWNSWALNSPDPTKAVLASMSKAVPRYPKL